MWIVPIVAVLVGISLVVHSIMQEGPTITVTFKTGSGLVANKTEVKYRNVVIGHVSDVELSDDQKSVNATIQLAKQAESFTRKDSQFWVVRPRIGAGGVSGIDTLLSGDYIGADIGQDNTRAKRFIGLENPPPITYGEPGKRFTLHTDDLGSLDIGSPVYYRKIPVGQVVAYALDTDGKGVNIEVFIHSPNDAYVTENTRFWNASGIDVNVGANGFAVKTESLSSLLVGGIAFRAPEYSPNDVAAAEEKSFELFEDQQTALAPPAGKAQYLVLRFEQALRGLKVGAPVEFLGVEFGRVVSVNLDFDAEKRSFPVNVGILIYPQRLGQAHVKMLKVLNHNPEDEAAGIRLIGTFIDNGLRAQARSGNLLTGQLYIALDFYPKAEKVVFDPTARPLPFQPSPAASSSCRKNSKAWSTRSISCQSSGSPATSTATSWNCARAWCSSMPRRCLACRLLWPMSARPCNRQRRPWPRTRRNASSWARPSTNSNACRARCESYRTTWADIRNR